MQSTASPSPKMDSPLNFFDDAEYYFETETTNPQNLLNVVVIGKVSSGKSSLLNALLGKTRKNSPFRVRAESGVTRAAQVLRLNSYLQLIDSPGLDDVNGQQSEITYQLFHHIDVGILVVEGSSDARQKAHLDQLSKHCSQVFVVLNKIDQYDKWQPFVLERLLQQWQEDLGIDRIYPTCTFGFDPEVSLEMQLDVRGVDTLKQDLETLLQKRWQELLQSRSQKVSRATLVSIIAPTLHSIAEAATVPRRSPFIPGLLTIALSEIHFQCWQRSLSGKSVATVLEKLSDRSCSQLGFCWNEEAHSPTFLLDPASLTEVLVESITLLVGASLGWQNRYEPTMGNLTALRHRVKTHLEKEVPSQWSGFVESLFENT